MDLYILTEVGVCNKGKHIDYMYTDKMVAMAEFLDIVKKVRLNPYHFRIELYRNRDGKYVYSGISYIIDVEKMTVDDRQSPDSYFKVLSNCVEE